MLERIDIDLSPQSNPKTEALQHQQREFVDNDDLSTLESEVKAEIEEVNEIEAASESECDVIESADNLELETDERPDDPSFSSDSKLEEESDEDLLDIVKKRPTAGNFSISNNYHSFCNVSLDIENVG